MEAGSLAGSYFQICPRESYQPCPVPPLPVEIIIATFVKAMALVVRSVLEIIRSGCSKNKCLSSVVRCSLSLSSFFLPQLLCRPSTDSRYSPVRIVDTAL